MALWADRITVKKATCKSPFELVYGTQAKMPINNLLPVYKFMTKEGLDLPKPMNARMEHLAELDEIRNEAQECNLKMQQKVKYLHDKRATERNFQEGELVLMWNARAQDKGKHGKFESLWIGPYVIMGKNGEDSYFLHNMDGEHMKLLAHG
ncbi:uncharacterized protein LOC131875928 [Cryptomeria japonica]|uniref:uncharacterized protein LOC131875928 n=1 Tax=Cryptomeria japonica TaxID=3369 RepID=UPI0027DA0744|nr:uncharacterized protein LOC131875928 [Cryptomeria japonica]